MSKRKPFQIDGTSVEPGSRASVELAIPELSAQTSLKMPVHVIHGKKAGPTLFLSAAVHGDELNGIEIIRRILDNKSLARMKGTLLAVPVVNAYGLIGETRYMPDRRDLNRCFPGVERGSLAARLAHLFMETIVSRCTHGIDLHTGSNHRRNLPQIRANLDDPLTAKLAETFGAPVMLNSAQRDGSLRAAAAALGIPVLLYEAGEALRFNQIAIRAGVAGIVAVMRELDMLPALKRSGKPKTKPFLARSSRWERAPESGMLIAKCALGEHVQKGTVLAEVVDPCGGESYALRARYDGVVIGRLELPKVYEGDAVYHIARFEGDASDVAEHVHTFRSGHSHLTPYD
ncbi:MAG: succinylglutamate desuccinylase/aspartoacylase family protein [Planctomycetes bacterium]|nr:succinylglutamate desuccinylase/aspartoacylase family protein [Planctomycetota bacterium]